VTARPAQRQPAAAPEPDLVAEVSRLGDVTARHTAALETVATRVIEGAEEAADRRARLDRLEAASGGQRPTMHADGCIMTTKWAALSGLSGGYSEETIRRWCAAGKVRSDLKGGQRLLDPESLRAYVLWKCGRDHKRKTG
jgi:hypothetical protein